MSVKTRYVCKSCGRAAPKWMGRCPECGNWNTLEEQIAPVEPKAGERRAPAAGPAPQARSLSLVDARELPRYRTGLEEFDRVLGGGLVPGSLVLVAGDPGIGKSTLLLQVGSAYAALGLRVLYVAAEESERQLSMRGHRLGQIHEGVHVLATSRLEAVAPIVENGENDLIIIDSIQTLHNGESGSAPGSIAQVRDNTLYFLELAKQREMPILLVGHVTKEGTVAGPRVVEHMVDAVLYLEGDRYHHFRTLRATKNRFGATHEVGVFEMGDAGLREVHNPSALLLEERREGTSGSVVTVALEGTRPLLLEIQALVGRPGPAVPRRVGTGVDPRRLAIVLAVLEARAGLRLGASDVFVNVAGGFRVLEPAVDLALAIAVASSAADRALDPRTVVLGEVGLGGEVRRVSHLDRRLREAAALGFTRAVVPASTEAPGDAEIELIPVPRVDEALARVCPRPEHVQSGTGGKT